MNDEDLKFKAWEEEDLDLAPNFEYPESQFKTNQPNWMDPTFTRLLTPEEIKSHKSPLIQSCLAANEANFSANESANAKQDKC